MSDYLQLVEPAQVTEHGLAVVEHEEHRLDVGTDLAHHRQLITGVEEILLGGPKSSYLQFIAVGYCEVLVVPNDPNNQTLIRSPDLFPPDDPTPRRENHL